MRGGGHANTAGLDARGLRIGIVRARFNESVTLALEAACRAALGEMGTAPQDIVTVTVPGALEVPLALQGMAESARFDALVALGCIIRGETYHFELVANESGAGVSRVGLDHHMPIANAILTVDNALQAQARQHEKGRDAAVVAVEMARLLQSLAEAADPQAQGPDARGVNT
jgi:6,7-dimethyl-8-ribityllumazine synthase